MQAHFDLDVAGILILNDDVDQATDQQLEALVVPHQDEGQRVHDEVDSVGSILADQVEEFGTLFEDVEGLHEVVLEVRSQHVTEKLQS